MTSQASEPRNERFSVAQAGEYVRLATSIEQHEQDSLSYEQLVQIAAEVGVSENALAAAIDQAKAEALVMDTVETPVIETPPWRAVANRCLEILCLKPPG